MNDPRVADDVLMDLAVARGNLRQIWRSVEELRGCARSAERTLEDIDVETAGARLAPEGLRGAAYLRDAGDQMEVLRQRCALGATLAGEIEERLEVAQRHLGAARDRLIGYEDAPETEVAGLRTRIEDLGVLVDLATPLAAAARTHMQEAAHTAAQLTTPSLADADREYAALRLDRGALSAGRLVVRADEAGRHLDRTLEYAGSGASRSLGQAEAVSNAAHARLGSAAAPQPTSLSGLGGPGGPSR